MGELLVERARVTVSMIVNAVVEISDDGYLGTTATVEEHIAKARQSVSNWEWYVRRGSATTEHERIAVRVKVEAVHVIPKED